MALSREQRIALARELARLAPPPAPRPPVARTDNTVRTATERLMAWQGLLKVGAWRTTSRQREPRFGGHHTVSLAGDNAFGRPLSAKERNAFRGAGGWPSEWTRKSAHGPR